MTKARYSIEVPLYLVSWENNLCSLFIHSYNWRMTTYYWKYQPCKWLSFHPVGSSSNASSKRVSSLGEGVGKQLDPRVPPHVPTPETFYIPFLKKVPFSLVCYTAVFSVVTQRSSPTLKTAVQQTTFSYTYHWKMIPLLDTNSRLTNFPTLSYNSISTCVIPTLVMCTWSLRRSHHGKYPHLLKGMRSRLA